MDEHDAFVEEILATPEDDGARLVYADWLDDHGDADRAEFIRVQVERARLHPADPRARALEARAAALLEAHGAAWAGRVRELASAWRFRRGFVEEVTLTAAAFLRHGDELFRLAPVRRLDLRGAEELPDLLRGPARKKHFADLLSRLSELDLGRNYVGLGDAAGLALLDLPRLPRLRFLGLARTALSLEGVRSLAGSPVLTGVRALEFSAPGCGPEGLQALLRSRRLGDLTSLRVANCRLGDRGVGLLARSRALPRLTELSLGHNGVSEAGAWTLAASAGLAGLTALDLSFNPLGPSGVRALVASRHLGRLDLLNLSRVGLGDAGAAALAASPLLGQLLGLDLSLNTVGDSGARALADYPGHARLGTLDLIYNPFGEPARQALVRRYGPDVCLFFR